VLIGWDEDRGLPLEFSPRRGAIWWRGSERLIHPFGWTGEAFVTNNVGSVIAGVGAPSDKRTTWLYTAWNGQTYDLGALEIGNNPLEIRGNYESTPFAMSDDGRVIVGRSGSDPPSFTAFIWTPETGMVSLYDYLKSKGVTGLDRWQRLTGAGAVTPDGKVIGGIGVHADLLGTPSWIVRLP
jgi:uncharacterized membrane protein